jgi:alpha-tubulin suppressor-like RCC1 family protein
VKEKGDVNFSSITTGGHICGLDGAGVAFCWGNNFGGQLGIGESGSPSFREAPTPVLTALTFEEIASEGNHTCALTADEQVWCWGSNSSGQLGPGFPNSISNVPVRVHLPPL